MHRSKRALVFLIPVLTALAATSPVWDGVYSKAQAGHGQKLMVPSANPATRLAAHKTAAKV